MKNLEDISSAVANQCPPGGRASRGGAEAAEKIGQSIAFMAAHLDQPLQVATLAARVNISPSHYFALFKRQTGSAPIDYFIQLRMERARALLESTSASVKEIAAALGYNDPFYFSRAFKSVNRVAPTVYRLQQQALREKTGRNEIGLQFASRVEPPKTFGNNDFDLGSRPLTPSGFDAGRKYQFA